MWFIYIFKAKIRCVNSQPPPILHPLIQNNNFEKQQKYLDKYDNNYSLTCQVILYYSPRILQDWYLVSCNFMLIQSCNNMI